MESEDIQMLNYKTNKKELREEFANTYVIAALHLLTAGHITCIKVTSYYYFISFLPHLELKRRSLRMHFSELFSR